MRRTDVLQGMGLMKIVEILDRTWSREPSRHRKGRLCKPPAKQVARCQRLSQALSRAVRWRLISPNPAERAEHASVANILDTYRHVLPNLQREAAERIDTLLRPALEH